MRQVFIAAGCSALLLVAQGCATITRGTSQSFEVKSEPIGANARLSTGQTCVTPCSLNLKRKTGFDIVFTKEGYRDATLKVSPVHVGKGTAGFVGNALIGGPIGAGWDLASGAMKDLSPNPASVTLQPLEADGAEPAQ